MEFENVKQLKNGLFDVSEVNFFGRGDKENYICFPVTISSENLTIDLIHPILEEYNKKFFNKDLDKFTKEDVEEMFSLKAQIVEIVKSEEYAEKIRMLVRENILDENSIFVLKSRQLFRVYDKTIELSFSIKESDGFLDYIFIYSPNLINKEYFVRFDRGTTTLKETIPAIKRQLKMLKEC